MPRTQKTLPPSGMSQRVIDALLLATRDENRDLRCEAVLALARMSAGKDRTLELRNDADPRVRCRALICLGLLQDERDLLASKGSSNVETLATVAGLGLLDLPSADTLSLLRTAAVTGAHPEIKRMAIWSLQELHRTHTFDDAADNELLLRIIKQSNEHLVVLQALRSLGVIGGWKNLDLLMDLALLRNQTLEIPAFANVVAQRGLVTDSKLREAWTAYNLQAAACAALDDLNERNKPKSLIATSKTGVNQTIIRDGSDLLVNAEAFLQSGFRVQPPDVWVPGGALCYPGLTMMSLARLGQAGVLPVILNGGKTAPFITHGATPLKLIFTSPNTPMEDVFLPGSVVTRTADARAAKPTNGPPARPIGRPVAPTTTPVMTDPTQPHPVPPLPNRGTSSNPGRAATTAPTTIPAATDPPDPMANATRDVIEAPERGYAALGMGIAALEYPDSISDGLVPRTLFWHAKAGRDLEAVQAACELALGFCKLGDAIGAVAVELYGPNNPLQCGYSVLGMGMAHASGTLLLAKKLGNCNPSEHSDAIATINSKASTLFTLEATATPLSDWEAQAVLGKRTLLSGLAVLGDKRAASLLWANWGHDPWVSLEAARAMGWCGIYDDVNSLITIVSENKDKSASAVAARSLGEILDPNVSSRLSRLGEGVPYTEGVQCTAKWIDLSANPQSIEREFHGLANPYLYWELLTHPEGFTQGQWKR